MGRSGITSRPEVGRSTTASIPKVRRTITASVPEMGRAVPAAHARVCRLRGRRCDGSALGPHFSVDIVNGCFGLDEPLKVGFNKNLERS